MELKRTFRSGVVLLELMASILIFALAGAVCVRVLMKADDLSAQSRRLDDGIRSVSSAAEILRSADDPEAALDALEAAWPLVRSGRELRIPLEEGNLRITWQEDNGFYTYDISWWSQGKQLYDLALCRSFVEVSP